MADVVNDRRRPHLFLYHKPKIVYDFTLQLERQRANDSALCRSAAPGTRGSALDIRYQIADCRFLGRQDLLTQEHLPDRLLLTIRSQTAAHPRVPAGHNVFLESTRYLLYTTSTLDLEVDHNDDGGHQQANDAKHDNLVCHDTPGHASQDTPRLGDVVICPVEGVPCMRDGLPLRMQVLEDASSNFLQDMAQNQCQTLVTWWDRAGQGTAKRGRNPCR